MAKRGHVYIASMNMRGKWADRSHIENVKILNVTSMQAKNSKARLLFSPMTLIEGGYKGYSCFENFWQSGKVYDGITPKESEKWWKRQELGKRRYPKGRGKAVLYSNYDGIERDYITSRKEVYVPLYYELIKDHVKEWKRELKKGTNIVVYDFDGPRDDNGDPICLKLTKGLLREKINYTVHPFGHGYVVGASLLRIKPEKYC